MSVTRRGVQPRGAGVISLRRALCFAICVAAFQLSAIEPAGAQGGEAQAEYHLKRGRVFLANGQYEEAIGEFDRAYTLNPSYEYLPEIAMALGYRRDRRALPLLRSLQETATDERIRQVLEIAIRQIE